jgi:hypothetical protein
MDRNNNIEEFLKENDSLIYSFFSGNLGEVVYIGKEQYLVYKHIGQLIPEKWSLVGKTKLNKIEHIIISVTTITNNEHNYSFNPEEEDYVEDILHKILSYKESMDQISNYFL